MVYDVRLKVNLLRSTDIIEGALSHWQMVKSFKTEFVKSNIKFQSSA